MKTKTMSEMYTFMEAYCLHPQNFIISLVVSRQEKFSHLKLTVSGREEEFARNEGSN